MLIRFGGVLTLVGLAVWLWGLFEALTAPADRIRLLPKLAWVVVLLLLLDIGAVLWFVFGRPRKDAGVRAGARGSVGPDDDPDFLRRLGEDMRRRRDDGAG